jgi:hypothetical protein
MDLRTYNKMHNKYSIYPGPKEVWDTSDHKAYLPAFHRNKECQIWDLKQRIKKAGLDY